MRFSVVWGRTGYMFAWQEYGVEPDVMTCAKALGCGVPVGAFVIGKKVADASLAPGDHGTTYGGNPFVCAAVSKVFDLYEKEQIVDHVKKVGGYLEQKLNALVEKYDFLKERRGKGLIQGLEVEGRPIGEIVNRGLEEGLIIITAGSNVLRFVPPLVVTEADVDEMIANWRNVFRKGDGMSKRIPGILAVIVVIFLLMRCHSRPDNRKIKKRWNRKM